MLRHTRIATTLDTARLGEALARPGMDTRRWTSLAVVTAVALDEGEGVFCDVTLMPSGQQETARVGMPYAGPGYGFHIPVGVDDEVLVEAPDGDPDNGLVITARLHSASDAPSQAAIDHPQDVVLAVQAGRAFRVQATKVALGVPDADQPTVRGGAYRSAEDTMLSAMSAAFALLLTNPTIATWAAGLSPANAAVLANFVQAIQTFQANGATYVTDQVAVP